MSSANHSLEICKTHAKWGRDSPPMTVRGRLKHGKKASQGGASSTPSLHRNIWGVSIQLHVASRPLSTHMDEQHHCYRVVRHQPCRKPLCTASFPPGSLWLLWLPTVGVSWVYPQQQMWKGENPTATASPLDFHELSSTTEMQRTIPTGSFKDRKETRVSVPQTSSEQLCSLFKGLYWAAPHYSSHLIPKDCLPE